jgi:hypothetical protein
MESVRSYSYSKSNDTRGYAKDYRLSSLLFCVAKITEAIIHSGLQKSVIAVPSYQNGFKTQNTLSIVDK